MFGYSLRNLFSRPMRSFLSLMGLTVAIAGMVCLFSIARGLDDTVQKTFGRIPGLIIMQPGAPVPLFSSLPASWGDELRQIPGVKHVTAEVWQRVNIIDGKTIVSPPRFFFGADIPERLKLATSLYRDDLQEGRFLTLADRGTRNCVVSRQIAEEFQKGVGDTLQVNGFDVKIVGIYHCGSLMLDIAIILDIEEVRKMTRYDTRTVSAYYVEQDGTVPDKQLIFDIRQHFAGREVETWKPSSLLEAQASQPGGTGSPFLDMLLWIGRTFRPAASPNGAGQNSTSPAPPASPSPSKTAPPAAKTTALDSPIEVRTASEWAQKFEEFSTDLDIFLSVMTGVGLTIAVLGIVNTMLMSVSERIIEFGILKANGWSRFDVLRLIGYESAILGVAGGILGAASGWLVSEIINARWPERVHLFASPGLLLFAVAFSTLLGALAGLYPALWAMRMTPMDAIRRG